MRNMRGVARIDESGHLSPDQKGVAIVFVRILPQVGKKIVFELHLFP
jgi:hypothetical protein